MRKGIGWVIGVLCASLVIGSVIGGAALSKPPTLEELNLVPFRSAIESGDPITIVGYGSSVGNGHSLDHPETDAPVAKLAELIREKYPDSEVTVDNRSVDGSDAAYGLNKFATATSMEAPTIVFFAYGMNEGGAYAYNAGSTYPRNMASLAAVAAAYRAAGSTILMSTTPSPHSGRMPWRIAADQIISYPAGATELDPLPENSIGEIDGVPFSIRHARFNDDAIAFSVLAGYLVADVVPTWVVAVAEHGENALYDSGESNHPNLLGHQSSYWPALQGVVDGL